MLNEEILKKAQEGDQKFIEKICSETWEPVYRYIYFRVQNRDEAEDITQETFVKALAWLKKNTVRSKNFIGFLKKVALNIIRDKWRIKKNHGPHIGLDAINPEESAVSDDTDIFALRELIQKGLESLNHEQRTVIDLRIIKGYSIQDTAIMMGKKEGAVKVMQQAFPDSYRFTLEIGNELEYLKDAIEIAFAGEEIIAERLTAVYEITPQGGQTYKIWVDKKTNLPLQKQSAMQNSLQYKVTYTEIEFVSEIPADIMAYQVPEGYSEQETNPEQMVKTIEEAELLAGFSPFVPEVIPEGYEFDKISVSTANNVIKFYYANPNQNTVILLQGKAKDTFKPAWSATLGKLAQMPLKLCPPFPRTAVCCRLDCTQA